MSDNVAYFAAQRARNEAHMMKKMATGGRGVSKRGKKMQRAEAKSEWVRDMLTQICRHAV